MTRTRASDIRSTRRLAVVGTLALVWWGGAALLSALPGATQELAPTSIQDENDSTRMKTTSESPSKPQESPAADAAQFIAEHEASVRPLEIELSLGDGPFIAKAG